MKYCNIFLIYARNTGTQHLRRYTTYTSNHTLCLQRHDLVPTYVTSCFVVVLFLFEVLHGCSTIIQAIMNNTGVYMGILLYIFLIYAPRLQARTESLRRFYRVPTIHVFDQKIKKITSFHLQIIISQPLNSQ